MDDYERLYASLIVNVGEKKDVPAGRVLDLYKLVYREDLPEEVRVRIRALTGEFLRERKRALLEEIVIRDEELTLIDRGLPFETAEGDEKIATTTQTLVLVQIPIVPHLGETRSEGQNLDLSALASKFSQKVTADATSQKVVSTRINQNLCESGGDQQAGTIILGGSGRKIVTRPIQVLPHDSSNLIEEHEAKLMLYAHFNDNERVGSLLPLPRRDGNGMVVRESVQQVIEIFQKYSSVDFHVINARLGLEGYANLVDILSCYRGEEIRDLVRIVNPYLRLRKLHYIILNSSQIEDVLPRLKEIKSSLGEGHISYNEVSKVLQRYRMPFDHELFDPVIETVFTMID